MATQEEKAKKVEAVLTSPIVSEDSNSPEQKMMSEAKQLQLQANTDTKYDAIVERFYVDPVGISKPLLGVTIAFSLLAISVFFTGLKKGR